MKVPQLANLPLQEAWAILNKNGLTMIVTPELNTRFQPGTVFEQNPAAGKTISRETQIKLKVATGLAEVEVPDLVKLSLPEAQKALQAKQLSIIASFRQTTKYPDSTVFGQEPPAGKIVTVGTPVSLSVANVPVIVEVPQLVGRPIGEVRVILSNLGLSMGASPEITEKYPPGTVFEQDFPPGTRLSITTPIKVKVAITSDSVVVPNVTGQPFEEAWSRFQDIKLAIVTDPLNTSGYQPGMVFGQSVPAGSKVAVGTPVTLKIATAPEQTAISNFRGQSIEDVEAALRKAGIPAAVSTGIISGHPPGAVVEQSIPAGSAAAIGTPIYIKVAVAPNTVEMPDLSGQPLSIAQAILQQDGLPMVVATEANPGVEPGAVFAQSTAFQNEIHVGAPVYLKVALGRTIVDIPECDSLNIEEAYQKLRALRLPMMAKTQMRTDYAPGSVFEQNPPAGSRVPAGSPVYFGVAVGRDSIVVPSLAGRPFEDAWAVFRDIRLPIIFLQEKTGEHPPGTLFGQITTAGNRVPVGTPVYLKMAMGSNEIAVPNLAGRPIAEVRKLLSDLQLPMILQPEVAAGYQPGTVFQQSLAAGEQVLPGAPIFLKISAGTETVQLPNLVGRPLEEVRGILQNAGLQLTLNDSVTGDYQPGTILAQEPLAGAEVNAGASVRVSIATALPVAPPAVEPGGGNTALPRPMLILAGAFGLLVILIVVFRRRKKKEADDHQQSEVTGETVTFEEGKEIDLETGLHFKTFPDNGRQYLKVDFPLILKERESSAAGIESSELKTALPNDEVAGARKAASEISELLQSSGFIAFGQLAEALNFSISLNAAPDFGRQKILVKGSLVLKEITGLEAGKELFASTETVESGDSVEMDIQEAAVKITDLFNASAFGTFAELAAALSFKLALKAVPDDGKQHLLVKGNLILKDDLTRIEGIGPKISKLLYSSGILSFDQLASINLKDIRKLLDDADLKFIDPATWPEQAKFAAEGDWEALDALQDELKGGKRIDVQESARKAGLQIADILQSAKFTSFSQLIAALKFDLGLKYVPDDGRQTIRVKGSLILKDDLTRIEGIGPKISRLLRKSGIISFTQLASAELEDLQKILTKAKLKYVDPATLPEQAKLAAKGDWEALDALQEKLKGGRRI